MNSDLAVDRIRERGLMPMLERVCREWNVLPNAVMSRSRLAILVRARDNFAYELRHSGPGWSYPAIGHALGLDHTTVMASVERHARLFGLDRKVRVAG